MLSIFNFGWRLVCLFVSYTFDASMSKKRNSGFEKKNAGFLYKKKTWSFYICG
jgi:hypothetical protein